MTQKMNLCLYCFQLCRLQIPKTLLDTINLPLSTLFGIYFQIKKYLLLPVSGSSSHEPASGGSGCSSSEMSDKEELIGKEFCTNSLFCVYLGYFSLVFCSRRSAATHLQPNLYHYLDWKDLSSLLSYSILVSRQTCTAFQYNSMANFS